MELVKLRIAFHQAQCGPEQYPPQPLASTLAEFGSSFMLAGIVIRNNGKPRILLDLAGIGKPTDITNFREETGNRELTNPFDSEHFLRIRHFSKDTGNQLVNLMQLLFSDFIYIQRLIRVAWLVSLAPMLLCAAFTRVCALLIPVPFCFAFRQI